MTIAAKRALLLLKCIKTGSAASKRVTTSFAASKLLHELPHHAPPLAPGHQGVEAQVAVVVEREPSHPLGGALVGGNELWGSRR